MVANEVTWNEYNTSGFDCITNTEKEMVIHKTHPDKKNLKTILKEAPDWNPRSQEKRTPNEDVENDRAKRDYGSRKELEGSRKALAVDGEGLKLLTDVLCSENDKND